MMARTTGSPALKVCPELGLKHWISAWAIETMDARQAAVASRFFLHDDGVRIFFCCVGCCCKEVGVLQRFVAVVLSLCEPGKSVEVRKREKEREGN